MRRLALGTCVIGLALLATACPGGGEGDGGVLGQVVDRDVVQCGVNESVPGFGFLEGETYSGFDIEFCRVVAAAVLGDADKVDFTALTAEQRFTALQAGEIDLLSRNTTFTASRDGTEGAAFVTTTFYDGQGMMVKADSGHENLESMGGTTICVLSGTTTELNLAAQFEARGIDFEPLSFRDNETLQQNFVQGRCDGWTSDKSQLAGIRSNWPEDQGGPEALRILDETMSKEPLGPVVRDGNSDWYDAVNWAVIATIQAWEFGITSANVDEMRGSTEDPEIRRFLGQDVEAEEGAEAAPFDPGLDLPTDFAYQVIKQVGNYQEIYNRHLGPDTPLGLEPGVNNLWTEGGLLYAPPYR